MTMSGLAANRRPRVVAPRLPRIIYSGLYKMALARVAKRLVSFFPLFHSFLHFTFFPLNFFLLLITINTANIISFSLSLSLSLPLTPSV